MEPIVIWGEVLFLIDFSIDFSALYFSLRLLRLRLSLIRVAAAAAVCAAFGIIMVCISVTGIWELILTALAAVGACMIAIPTKQFCISELLKTVVLFVFLEVTAGGMMTTIFFALNRWFTDAGLTIPSGDEKRRLFWIIAAGLSAGLAAIRLILDRAKAKHLCDDATLTIHYGNAETSISCLLDTGNLAREPISGLPVVFLPQSCAESLEIDVNALTAGSIPRSRLIQIRSINETSLCWGIHPTSVILHIGTPAVQRKTLDAYIIFSTNTDHAAIIPACFMN